jgi:hypothetical protein
VQKINCAKKQVITICSHSERVIKFHRAFFGVLKSTVFGKIFELNKLTGKFLEGKFEVKNIKVLMSIFGKSFTSKKVNYCNYKIIPQSQKNWTSK